MKFIQIIFALLIFNLSMTAQLNITYTINANTGYKKISPYIYGSCNGGYSNTTFMRQGGNRITGYNWENNASNAGVDYINQSDDYLTWVAGINFPQSEIPAIVTTSYVDSANARSAFSAITLQMAGYVAKDKNGTSVTMGETAPSARWCSVSNTKPSAFSMTPDLSDNVVYMDEYMNFLINTLGNSTTSTGVKAYIMDNETALWSSSHPRLHPGAPNVVETVSKSIALATRIKEMDANAKVFGPESYGFDEYVEYQGASDWPSYSGTYPYFLSFYLDSMRQSSLAVGHRLLDVLSVHWYPDVYTPNVFSQDSSSTVTAVRVQLPRSLWDNSFVENGWIGQWFSSSLPIIPTLQNQIATYYPNTELAITEYDYGGDTHISGGIAEADALGAFAKTGVMYASKWNAFEDFSLSAVQLYNDVPNPFMGYYTNSSCTALNESSVHSCVEDTVNKTLHVIAINRNIDSTIQATININSTTTYDSVTVYWFHANHKQVQTLVPVSQPIGNNYSYSLEKGGVYHFVFKSSTSTASINDNAVNDGVKIYPNPVENLLNVELSNAFENINGKWSIIDMSGKVILQGNIAGLTSSINVGGLAKGNYSICIESDGKRVVKKFVK